MTNCKNYTIYKFFFATKMNTEAGRKENWKRAQEYTDFKLKLINNFSPENFDELVKYTFFSEGVLKKPRIPYKKNWLLSQFDIGMDMVKEKYGCKFECHWGSDYMAIPKIETELIKFFENNKPDWVKNVTKI
jgi:hypothetical protein